MKKLTEAEYLNLLNDDSYGVIGFMGGFRPRDGSGDINKIIYLVGSGIYMPENKDERKQIEEKQLIEAEQFASEYEH